MHLIYRYKIPEYNTRKSKSIVYLNTHSDLDNILTESVFITYFSRKFSILSSNLFAHSSSYSLIIKNLCIMYICPFFIMLFLAFNFILALWVSYRVFKRKSLEWVTLPDILFTCFLLLLSFIYLKFFLIWYFVLLFCSSSLVAHLFSVFLVS